MCWRSVSHPTGGFVEHCLVGKDCSRFSQFAWVYGILLVRNWIVGLLLLLGGYVRPCWDPNLLIGPCRKLLLVEKVFTDSTWFFSWKQKCGPNKDS